MKIGILTFHRTTNYGACLQCVALTTYLNSRLNVEAETIDYRCKSINQRELHTSVFSSGVLHAPIVFLLNCNKRIKFQKINSFIKQNGKLSIKTYDETNIDQSNGFYDKYIVGSDIVWELNVTGEDYNYFLIFVNDNNRKYSYSASFGYSEIPNQYKGKVKKQLCKFNKISVRENAGALCVKQCIGIEPPVTVDPTLLLNPNEWEQMERAFPIRDKYVFLYFDDEKHQTLDYALKIGAEQKLKVVFLTDSIKNIKGVKCIRNVSVNQFIWLIHNAESIVTGSYHGVLFSILFQKEFYYYNRNHSSRIETIVNALNIQNRGIDSSAVVNVPLDWENIVAKLENIRSVSQKYLESVIND